LLNEITPANAIESNLKYALEVYLDYYSQGNEPDSLIKAEMTSIAHQHPFYGGESVYMLRDLLHLVVRDILPANRIMQKPSLISHVSETFKGNIHPNPAFNSATYTCNLQANETGKIVITNAIGELILMDRITGSNTLIETNSLPAGIYYYLVAINDEIKDKGKLIINH
jgi:hypothetical protein